MRILHILTMLEIGGAQHNTIATVADSLRRGHSSRLLAAPGPLSSFARERLAGALIESASLSRSILPVRDIAAMREISEIIRRFSPDIVHTHSSKAGILGRRAAHRAGVRTIIHTAHGWAFHDRQNIVARRFYEECERRAARITDKIIVVADANREKALGRGIGRPDQYVTIRSGIERPPDARANVRKELGISDNAFLVVAVGNFKPQKSPLDMARIMSRVLRRRPNIGFISVGDGPLKPDAQRILPEGRFLGWRDDAARILSAGDLLLHTAIFEGLPRVILEALSLGIPIVSTNVDGIPEAVENGVSGLLYPPGSIDEMTDAIIRLHDDAELRRQMSEAARRGFREEFTIRHMLDKIHELYTT